MFATQRRESSIRMNELRGLLDVIKLQESSDPQIPDPAEVLILRGLFYVHLYAVFEFSVNQAVQRFLVAQTEA